MIILSYNINTKEKGESLTMIKRRSIAAAIILSLVTCGIYYLYWFIALTNETNYATGNENDTSGGMAFLLTIITCGIYGFFWAYKMGEKIDTAQGVNKSRSIIYLVLNLFGLSIVTYALIQDTLNKEF